MKGILENEGINIMQWPAHSHRTFMGNSKWKGKSGIGTSRTNFIKLENLISSLTKIYAAVLKNCVTIKYQRDISREVSTNWEPGS